MSRHRQAEAPGARVGPGGPTDPDAIAGLQRQHIDGVAGKSFVFLSHWHYNLYRFRLPLMRRLIHLGAQVYAMSPPLPGGDPDLGARLFSEHGVEFVPVQMRGASLNLLDGSRAIAWLAGVLRRMRPNVLHTFTLKANVIGALAARIAPECRVLSTVTGLGRMYVEDGRFKGSVLARVADEAARLALRRVSRVVFQNPEDRAEFLSRRLCRTDQASLIVSSGIDLDEFSPRAVDARRRQRLREEWGLEPSDIVVTMVARLLASKGVREYVAAAAALRGRAKFVLIGPTQTGRGDLITDGELATWQRAGTIIAPGLQRNIEEWLAITDIYALPTYYREGVPRTNLEAMAMELPIITTSTPGSRETVVDGYNGFMIPPRDTDSLVASIGRLVDDPDLRRTMGARSRGMAYERFSIDHVVEQYMRVYAGVLAG